MKNLFFLSTFLLLIIAVVLVIFEVGANAKIAVMAIKDGDKVSDQLKEKQSTFERSARITYLFGLAAITTFLLAIVTLAIG